MITLVIFLVISLDSLAFSLLSGIGNRQSAGRAFGPYPSRHHQAEQEDYCADLSARFPVLRTETDLLDACNTVVRHQRRSTGSGHYLGDTRGEPVKTEMAKMGAWTDPNDDRKTPERTITQVNNTSFPSRQRAVPLTSADYAALAVAAVGASRRAKTHCNERGHRRWE
jgi:hypothetical protein